MVNVTDLSLRGKTWSTQHNSMILWLSLQSSYVFFVLPSWVADWWKAYPTYVFNRWSLQWQGARLVRLSPRQSRKQRILQIFSDSPSLSSTPPKVSWSAHGSLPAGKDSERPDSFSALTLQLFAPLLTEDAGVKPPRSKGLSPEKLRNCCTEETLKGPGAKMRKGAPPLHADIGFAQITWATERDIRPYHRFFRSPSRVTLRLQMSPTVKDRVSTIEVPKQDTSTHLEGSGYTFRANRPGAVSH